MAKLRAFTMPKWGIEMTEGTVAEWMIAEGEDFAKGHLLTLIETDKITNEVEAEFEGRLARIIVAAGQTMPVGALLAVFADGDASPAEVDEFIASFRSAGIAGAAAQKESAPVKAGAVQAARVEAAPQPAQPVTGLVPDGTSISPAARARALSSGVDVSNVAGSSKGGRITLQDVVQASRPEVQLQRGEPVSIAPTTGALDAVFASPLAKRLAVQHAVDLADIRGTGPRGRICKSDVLAAVPEAQPDPASAASSDEAEVLRMSPMRKAIARQLSLSKQTIPHFYLRSSVRVDGLLAARAAAKRAVGEAPSLNDYIIRGVALALRAHPDVNIQVHGEEIHRFRHADVSVAVSTDKGLITPIIRAAETKTVSRISGEMRQLAERARSGRIALEEIQGGSFSISNLGMYGIDQFDAIINPPQGAILAVGAATRQVAEQDHAVSFPTIMHVSLSCDHRAIDGAVGAEFLRTLRTLLEHPERLTE